MEEIVAGGLTEQGIRALKAKHGKIRLVTVLCEGITKNFWFKKPSMATLSAYMKFAQNDPLKAGQIIFNDCLVKGDKDAVNDPEIFMSILPNLTDIIKKLETEVKEF